MVGDSDIPLEQELQNLADLGALVLAGRGDNDAPVIGVVGVFLPGGRNMDVNAVDTLSIVVADRVVEADAAVAEEAEDVCDFAGPRLRGRGDHARLARHGSMRAVGACADGAELIR